MVRTVFLDPSSRLRTFWRFLVFAVGFVGIQLVIAVVAAVGLVLWTQMQGELSGDPFDGRSIERIYQDWALAIILLSAVPQAIAVSGLAVFCRYFLDRRPVRTMGMTQSLGTSGVSITVGVLLGVLPVAGAEILLWQLGAFHFDGLGGWLMPMVLVPVLVMMAFMEEIMFRGYLLQNFLDIRRPAFGVLFTSVTFWLIHSFNPGVWQSPVIALNLFGAGIVLALAYLASGSLWFATALHFGWNFAQGGLFGVPISGLPVEGLIRLECDPAWAEWLTGGPFGLEGSLVATGVEVGLIAGLAATVWRRGVKAARYENAAVTSFTSTETTILSGEAVVPAETVVARLADEDDHAFDGNETTRDNHTADDSPATGLEDQATDLTK